MKLFKLKIKYYLNKFNFKKGDKIMKFGIEWEMFATKPDGTTPILLKDELKQIPHDDCGWLIEYRGKPQENITDAVYSVFASRHKKRKLLSNLNVYELKIPILKLSNTFKQDARFHFNKNQLKYKNLYGYKTHKNTKAEATAGIHISITKEQKIQIEDKNKTIRKVNTIWDFCSFIRHMDKNFKDEIKSAKRNPGFYELKYDGRLEYRSLPNDISFSKLIEVIENYNF